MAGVSGALDAYFRIDDKIAVVTDSGACSSVDVAPMLARAGARVIIADRDAAAVDALARSIDPTGNARAETLYWLLRLSSGMSRSTGISTSSVDS